MISPIRLINIHTRRLSVLAEKYTQKKIDP